MTAWILVIDEILVVNLNDLYVRFLRIACRSKDIKLGTSMSGQHFC